MRDLYCMYCGHTWEGEVWDTCPSCHNSGWTTTYLQHLIGKASYDESELTKEELDYLELHEPEELTEEEEKYLTGC